MDSELLHKDLTQKIIGFAYEVYNQISALK